MADPHWRRARACGSGNCVEIAAAPEGVLIRNSTSPDSAVSSPVRSSQPGSGEPGRATSTTSPTTTAADAARLRRPAVPDIGTGLARCRPYPAKAEGAQRVRSGPPLRDRPGPAGHG
ncbi:DUF397 domain-containing protein [Nocardia acidivorans]|uniref:DUF397 domain-containing protein n=1 Tax=Nocardia acidivorans TaxID=404580 RepID=UPI000A0683A4